MVVRSKESKSVNRRCSSKELLLVEMCDSYDQSESPDFPICQMRHNLFECDLIVCAISAILVESLDGLRYLFFSEELGLLRKVDDEKPADNGGSDSR